MNARPLVSRERALSHRSRVALLELLEASAEPLDAAQLAAAVGLHVNTVRSHLGVLEQAGLVSRTSEPRIEPGRPRQLFAATAAAATPESSERYQLMARMLASYIAANVPDPAAAAEETGRQWGRHLVAAPEPFSRTTEEDALQALLALLDDLDCAPRLGAEPSEVELRHCPFRGVAEAHPEVACSLHLGLMRGAMAQLEAPLVVEDLVPFVDAERCVARVSAKVAS
jgi:predicted ArsR family transcriptional regulator